jgi:hypothetical protein
MGIKAALSRPYAAYMVKKRNFTMVADPIKTQKKWMDYLLRKAELTAFGINHSFPKIRTYSDWKKNIPVRDYEELLPYFERILNGEESILWPGRPQYLAKTSGTTAGAKYIPITRQSMPFHIQSAKMALLSYIHESRRADFVDGKMIFLQGSPALEDKNGLKIGRLSGITAHHVPAYLQRNRLPSKETNLIADWEQKVDAIVLETADQDLRLISGIPAWVQMYFERLLEHTGKKTVMEVFPNFSLFVYGGVNFAPYKQRFRELIGADIPSVELFPASEGFFAYQDTQHAEGLLLELDSGIFYEFIPVEEFGKPDAKRIWLDEVEIGQNYALIVNSVAGLWGYNIGDTVKFVSTEPHRIIVTGRLKHFTSAFGEHVIAEEVESAMQEVCEALNCSTVEFHLAPQVTPSDGLPYHEWFIEFAKKPEDEVAFAKLLYEALVKRNPYYKDLIKGSVLRPLRIQNVKQNGFMEMMKERGKLGGQNKIPRLANDRKIADVLSRFSA